MRNLGGAVGLAMINTLATSRLAVHTLHLEEQVTWSRPAAMRRMGNMTQCWPPRSRVTHLAALKRVAMMVQQQALTLTYNDVLLLMAAVSPGSPADAAAGQARGGCGGGGALNIPAPYNPCTTSVR